MPLPSAPCSARPVLVAWPAGAARRASLAAEGTPCLLVIEPGSPVPALGAGEDWIARDADERDVAARLGRLARTVVAGAAWPVQAVPLDLAPHEQRVATILLSGLDRLVPYADLPVGDLDAVLPVVEQELGRHGFAVTRVGDAGLLLEREVAVP